MKLLFITRKVDKQDSLAGFTYSWILEFSRHCTMLYVICLEKGDIEGLPDHVQIYSLGKEKGKNRIREFILYQVYAARLMRRVDGVFSHMNPEYGILIAPWARLFRKYLVAWYTHRSVTWKLRLLTWSANKMVTASKESFRLETKKLRILHHGIRTDYFVPAVVKRHAHTLLTISRLSRSKNIHKMIELVGVIRDTFPDITLKIIGGPAKHDDYEYEKELHRIVEDEELQSSVQFLGPIAHHMVLEQYQSAGIFLNFSETGSLDKTVLEAMSCETPVVVSNEAYADILQSIEPRMFAEAGRERESVQSLLLNPITDSTRKSMRSYVVDHHSLSSLAHDILELYPS